MDSSAYLGGHDSITSRHFETSIHILPIQDIPIGEYRDLEYLFDFSNDFPICQPSHLAFHLPRPPVTRKDLSTGSFHHFGIGECTFQVGEYTEFGSNWYSEVFVQCRY